MITVLKEMVNKHNPMNILCYIVVADVDGIVRKSESKLVYTGDAESDKQSARASCIAKLEKE